MIGRLYNNQKAVRIFKTDTTRENGFALIDMDALNGAIENLNNTAFKLWIYLAKNAKGYEFGLSRAATSKAIGVSSKGYYNAVKELIDKGYLVKEELYPNLWGYVFYDKGLQTS